MVYINQEILLRMLQEDRRMDQEDRFYLKERYHL